VPSSATSVMIISVRPLDPCRQNDLEVRQCS
jgi:hypothetical protein